MCVKGRGDKMRQGNRKIYTESDQQINRNPKKLSIAEKETSK